jgi:hypothetical protein
VRFVFADERIAADMILTKIRESIAECQFALCDVTGWNPNVCLEFGLAIGMGKPVHILYRTGRPGLLGRIVGRSQVTPDDLPIDMRGYDRIDYANAQGLTLGLEKLIEQEMLKPDPGIAPGMRFLREKIYKLIESNAGLKKTEIASRLGLEVADIGPVVDRLHRAGRIERRGKYNNAVFYAHGTAPPEDAATRNDVESEEPPISEEPPASAVATPPEP